VESCKVKFSGVTILQVVEFPIFLLIFAIFAPAVFVVFRHSEI